jgi:hypothetical protein
MNTEALKEEINKFILEEVKESSAEIFAFTIGSNYLDSLHKTLVGFFGPPLKPAERKPTRQEKKQAEPYGGIRIGQTLYYSADDNAFSIALIWPWGNGEKATVKIFSDQPLVVQSESLWKKIVHRIF